MKDQLIINTKKHIHTKSRESKFIKMNKYEQEVKVDRKKVIEKMEIGMKSCLVIRDLIIRNENNNKDNNVEFYKVLDHHSMLTLDSFHYSISMLKRLDCDDDQVFVEKRKSDDDFVEDDVHLCKSEVFDDQHSPQFSIVNCGITRVSNKKRKIGVESREEVVTQLSDDGFAWRKYGQKKIIDSHYPRNYFRCTHKFDKKCEATKQIQRLSQTKYKIRYNDTHTCNKNTMLNNTYPYLVESQLEENSSSINFSFDGSSPINPLLFQAFGSVVSYNPTILKDTSQMSSGVSSNSSNCEEITTEIENYSSSTATSVDLEYDYSFILADLLEIMPILWD